MLTDPEEEVTAAYVYFPLSCLGVKGKDLPSYPHPMIQDSIT